MALMMAEQRNKAAAGITRAKATFAKRAAEIAGKRLDLAEAEHRHRLAR